MFTMMTDTVLSRRRCPLFFFSFHHHPTPAYASHHDLKHPFYARSFPPFHTSSTRRTSRFHDTLAFFSTNPRTPQILRTRSILSTSTPASALFHFCITPLLLAHAWRHGGLVYIPITGQRNGTERHCISDILFSLLFFCHSVFRSRLAFLGCRVLL